MSASAEYRLITFRSDQVADIWPTVAEILEPCPREPGMSLEDVRKQIEQQDAQLWTVWIEDRMEAAWISRIQYDSDKSLYCLAWMCAGENADQWIHLSKHMEDWARDMGCKDVRVVGRPGWKKYGYKPLYTVMSKSLET
jgi:hypothetical protein